MAAYLVVEAVITDRKKFAAYAQRVPGAVARAGGEYLALGGEAEALEGDWGEERLVVHRWPDMAAARRFWHSDEYRRLKKLREGTGRFRVMLVDGCETGEAD